MEGGGVIVVVGSLHYDIMVDAPRLPVSGETLPGTGWRPKFGGKGGNQAIAAAAAGAPVRMAGAVGDDGFGAFLLARLDAGGVDRRHVAVRSETGSGMSVAIGDAAGDYAAVIVSGANLAIEPADLGAPALWEDAKLLLLQNEVPDAVNLAAARSASARSVPVLLNAAPARSPPAELAGLVGTLVVNAVEAEQLCGVGVSDLASAAAAARRLTDQFATAVVTAGAHGLAAADQGGTTIEVPAQPVRVVSTHGAGDVFVGCFAAALLSGMAVRDALQAGNRAAARHVSRSGGL